MAKKFQSMRSRRNEGSSLDAKGAEQTTSASPPGQTTEDPNGGHEATASGEVTFRHPFDAGNEVVSSPATETAPKQRKGSWWNRRRSSVQRILSVAFKKDKDKETPGSGFLVFRSGADGGNFRTSIGQLHLKDEEVTRTASARVNAEEQIRASFSNPPVEVEPGTSLSRSTSNASRTSSQSPCDSSLDTGPSTAGRTGRSRVEKWLASSASGSEGPAEKSRLSVPRKRRREEETSAIIDPETATVDSATAVKSGKAGYVPKSAASGFLRTTTPQAGNAAESAEETAEILSTPTISQLSTNWALSVNNAMVQAVEVASLDRPKQQPKRRQYDSYDFYDSYDSYDSYEDYDYEINTPEPDKAAIGTTRFMTPQNRPCASPAPPLPPKHHRRESWVYQESPLPMPTHGEYLMCNDYRAFENHRLAIAAEKVRNRYWDPLTGDWEQPGDDVYLEAAAWSAQSSPGDWRRVHNNAQRQISTLGSYAYENGYPSPTSSAYPSASASIAFGDYYVRRRTSSLVDPLTNRELLVIEEDGDIWLEEPMAFEDDAVGGSGEWESQQPYWSGESAGNTAWDLSEVEWPYDSQKAATDGNAAGQALMKGKRVDSLDAVQDEANDEDDVAHVMGQGVPGGLLL